MPSPIITIRINPELKAKAQEYCKRNSIALGTLMKHLLAKEIDQNPQIDR